MVEARSTKSTKSTAKKATKKVAKKVARTGAAALAGARTSLAEAMRALEAAGSAQTRKTYARHGVPEPMFGVSFAVLKGMVKRIGVDQDLATALWETGNHDARTLAVKVADPATIAPALLDAWASEPQARMCGGYVAMLAAESPHGWSRVRKWLASTKAPLRIAGWHLVGQLANHDESTSDAWFAERIEEIEKTIHAAPSEQRYVMNSALIGIGGRNAALRKAALAAAKRIGPVEVDHGDTACTTPDAPAYIEKTWAHAKAKKFDSPAAQERAREKMRTRC